MNSLLSLMLMILSFPLLSKTVDEKVALLRSPSQMMKSPGTEILNVERFEKMFSMNAKTPGLSAMLKRNALRLRQKAVPSLIKVMKNDEFPEQNRWQATMLLAQIMGTQAAPFIAKFSTHPHWMMRVASLKALLGLKQSSYHAVYSHALKDPSLIVRVQALDTISKLKITELAPKVWAMLYDQSNYSGETGSRKRTSIVKTIIRTLGDVEYKKAQKPLAKLIQKPKYHDLIDDLDYSLEKISGEKSPNSLQGRRAFWAKVAL